MVQSDNDEDQAVLCVEGSVALDTHAKTTIKSTLHQSGIKVLSERLVLPGKNGWTSDASGHGHGQSYSMPRLVFLVSTVAGTEEGLEELLSLDAGPNSLNATFGSCFSIITDPEELEKLFPSATEDDVSHATNSDTVATPDNERRIFTFINDELTTDEEDEATEEVEEADKFPSDLPVPPKSPLQAPRNPLGRLVGESEHKDMNAPGGGSGESAPSMPTGQSVERPGSVIKSRKPPSSTSSPSITPRLSKAAALRMGIALPEKPIRRKPEEQVEVDENGDPVAKQEVFVPGTVRRAVTPPKSLSKPAVMPKQTKASAMRQMSEIEREGPAIRPATTRRQSLNTWERSAGFEGLPGFAKRKVQPPSPDKIRNACDRVGLVRQDSQDRTLSPLPQASKPRQSLTTAERAAACASYTRGGGGGAPNISPIGSLRSGRASVSGRPALSATSSRELFTPTRESSNPLSAPSTRKPLSRSSSIAPRPNKAAELRLAARQASTAS